jgi:hypothetical protein
VARRPAEQEIATIHGYESREAASFSTGRVCRSELEERVASGLGVVLLDRVIDADPQLPQDADGWPKVRPDQRTNDARSPERLECAP